MVENKITLKNGFEASDVAKFVQLAGKFGSDIRVHVDGKRANGKSIMGLISLGLFEDAEVTIICDGSDEKQCLEELSKLVSSY